MSARPGDCPHCRAPAPIAGLIEHAWDCPLSREPKRFHDWSPGSARKRSQPIRSVKFTPLPPLAELPEEELIDLIALALEVEAGWARVAAQTKTRSANA